MAVFKNVSGSRLDIPLYDLHVGVDETFEVPDEVAGSFDAQPAFSRSKTQSPTVTVDPQVVEDATVAVVPAPAAPVDAAPVGPAPTDPTSN